MNDKKNVIVVGGGAAGMMAAYAAASNGHQVTLLERNEKLGKKIYITGKGRCNVTNAGDTTEFFDSVVSNPKFLYSSIYGFDAGAVMEFFEKNGCPLKIERGNRVFPVSDHSSDIIKCLEKTLVQNHVILRKNTIVRKLLLDEEGRVCGVEAEYEKQQGGEYGGRKTERFDVDAVILATGGVSYPVTGSDGNMHKILEKLGHKVVSMRPGLVPLETEGEFCRQMQGLSLKNVRLTLLSDGKVIYEEFGEMLFTHFGLSGPLVLSAASYMNALSGKENKMRAGKHGKDADREGAESLGKTAGAGKRRTDSGEWIARIDLKPALTNEQLDQRLLREFEKAKNKHMKNILGELLPSKMISVIPKMAGVPSDKPVNEITKEERLRLLNTLKGMEFTITGTRDFHEAIITIGGIDTKEVNPSTMESKKIPGLYLAGEMLDVDALTGGYNLQIAWSTGYLAGSSV